MIDRGKPGKAIGESLLEQSNTLFHVWHQLRQGKRSRACFQQAMRPVRQAVKMALQRGEKSRCSKTAGARKGVLGPQKRLWTLLEGAGGEPTDQQGERTQPHRGLPRKARRGDGNTPRRPGVPPH